MDEDPFASIINQCQITSSQEEKLRICPFALQPEDEGTSPYSVQPTGIFMVSPPETCKDHVTLQEEEEEDFHTPPEHPRSQSISGSEDQGPVIGAVDPPLIKNNDGGDDVEVLDMDNGFTGVEKTVDLGKDSDALGFSEAKLVKEIDGGDGNLGVVCDRRVGKEDIFEGELKKFRVSEGESASGKNEFCGENFQTVSPIVNLGDTEPIVIESERIEIGATELVDLEYEENCEGFGEWLTENTVDVDKGVKGANGNVDKGVKGTNGNVDKGVKGANGIVDKGVKGANGNVDEGVKGANGGGHSASKNIEDIDAFRYVAGGGVDKCGMERGVSGRRELPGSFKEPEENEGLWVPRRSKDNMKTFKDLCDAVGIVGDDSTGTNFLKTAKERGLSFPRPRWWPREGYDDQV